tara:strand:+ start:28514 stop:29050 length:537 start_codon:yes stop_codon:yes gene_type:complete
MKKSYEKIVLASITAAIAIALTIGIHSKSGDKKTAEFETVIPSSAVEKELTTLTATPEPEISNDLTETVSDFDYSEVTIPEYNRQGEVGFTFSEAFKDAREKLGPRKVFVWNGTEYTTDMAEDVLPEVDTVDLAVEEAVESETDETDVIDDGSPEFLLGTSTLTDITGGSQTTDDEND